MNARRFRLLSIVVALCALVGSLTTAVVPAASAAAKANPIWSPFPVVKAVSVKGHSLARGAIT